ncbi:hypothetical protein Sste5346_008270 [Sporothrix stenoceras]|uniref:Protein HRI1 n=1 Tax=Sporothrix stenoceras TaxID=5173 RepID=A0ABR3YR89_9PEZI
MPARLSTRISIRWGDDEASEPTETLVMSVGGYFMDLRVVKADNSVDWAFAGTRDIVARQPKLHCRWHHVIDSHNTFAPDEGFFTDLPNGDSLETGSMACMEKGGAVTDYEEIWRALPTEGLRAWILKREDAETNNITFLGRVGSEFFAMVQKRGGGPLTVQREVLEEDKWVVKYQSGGAALPSLVNSGLSALTNEVTWKQGDEADVQGEKYTVCSTESSS